MKITKTSLKKIIREEIEKVLYKEEAPFNPATGEPQTKKGEQLCAQNKPEGCFEKYIKPLVDKKLKFSPIGGTPVPELIELANKAGVLGGERGQSSQDPALDYMKNEFEKMRAEIEKGRKEDAKALAAHDKEAAALEKANAQYLKQLGIITKSVAKGE